MKGRSLKVLGLAIFSALVSGAGAAAAQPEAAAETPTPEATAPAASEEAASPPQSQLAQSDSEAPAAVAPSVADQPEPPDQMEDSVEVDSAGAEPPPVVSSLDFEAAAYLTLTFGEQAVPDVGSINPLGGSAFAAIRYVPRTFPFHVFFQAGGGLVATGTTTGPSGTEYSNVLSALFFSPGVGLDVSALRLEVGIGPALVFASTSSKDESSSSTSLAVSGEVGLSYRFLEKTTWAMSAGVRYQTVPGAGIESMYLGAQVRFGSILYR